MRGLFAAALALTIVGPVQAGAPEGSSLKVGQTFQCTDAEGKWGVTIVIGRIDQTRLGEIVSVSMTPLMGFPEMKHLPFLAANVTQGCTPTSRKPLSPDFKVGYARWKSAFDAGEAKAFDKSPSDVYRQLLEQLRNGQ